MKKAMGWAVLAMAVLALPVMAQDEADPAEASAPAADAGAPADDASAGSSSEDTSAAEAVTSGDSAAEATSSEDSSTIATDEGSSSGDEGGDGGSGRTFYVGLDYDMTKIDINDRGTREALGRRRFESNFYKLRLGARIFEGVGLEFHAGFPDNDASARKLETKQFYALYLVPTGVLFDLVEVSARIGYAYTELESELGKDDADGASFGLAVEVPLRHFGEGMPNLRIGAGGTVYQEERDGRVFGWHGGVRYDFTL
jgi:hypothetical protein